MPAPESAASAPLELARVANELGTRRLAGPLRYFTELDSTNALARTRAEAGAVEGEIIVAETQTLGRGRLGRRWASPPFANLYLSAVLRPRLAPRHAAQITLTAAVALAETVLSVVGRAPAIKWPNDILFAERKLAGILTEAVCAADRVHFVILGIGLNVNYRTQAMPEELRERATSLAEIVGRELSRESVLTRLIQDLDRCYGELEDAGFEALRSRWEQYFGQRGRLVRAEHGERVIVGRALGIDAEGGLILQDDRGESCTIIAGDVVSQES